MMFLSINTATDICSVSLYNDKKFITLSEKNTREHSKYLPVFTKELIENKRDKLKYIALCIGPGSFTGLKIGSSFAKGLACSLKIPIVPVDIFNAFRLDIKNVNKYFLAIYSHKDYAFSCFYDKNKVSDYKCMKLDYINDYPIFGYGFPNNLNIDYKKVIPCSEKIGLLSIDQFNLYKNESIDNINPIYLNVEK